MQSRPTIDPYGAGATTVPGAASVAAPEGAPALPPRVSWGAIIAGSIIALTVGLMLNTLGVGIGASTVDAVSGDTPSATGFGIGAGLWLVVSNLIGLAAGGYVAARLSGTADGTDAVLHGLGVWATTFLVSAVLLGNLVGGAASMMSGAVSGVAGGATRGAGSAVSAVAGQADPQAMLERAKSALTGPSDPARMTSEQRGAEITGLIGRRVAHGSFADDERQRLNTLVAADAGIPQQEAARRVQAYEADAQRTATEAGQRARRAADAAASGTATAGYLLFAALLLGAAAAAFGARAGARNLLVLGGARRRAARVSA
jgi:hypothetical protein